MKTKHVAVLMGGWSSEREVSLVSGAGVVKALTEKGYRVTAIDVQRDIDSLLRALSPRPDVVFNALHGRGGEDGTIQGVLEFLGLPYTHSGVTASAVAMDKQLTRLIAETQGVPVARGLMASQEDVLSRDVLPPPYVIKPVNEGSSVGVRIVRESDNYKILAEDSWIYGENVLVEQYVPGRELTAAVMGDRALTVTELRPKSGFYDYTNKYTDGMTEHIVPADIPPVLAEAVMRHALAMHNVLGCKGLSRSDFRWDDTKPGTEGLFFLEINTQPGFTPLSLTPEQAAHCGISYAELCVWLVEQALGASCRKQECAA
jgi:D-alanine-D-alanine ligase